MEIVFLTALRKGTDTGGHVTSLKAALKSDSDSKITSAIVVALLVFSGTWLAYRQWYYSLWMDDDAFISFRYAKHLTEGNGLVFNIGEYVEGYSNFLWTLFLAWCSLLGLDIPIAAQAAGIVFSFATILVLSSRRFRLLPPSVAPESIRATVFGASAPLFLCFSEEWAVWAVGGLENPFGALVVTLLFLSYFSYLSTDHPSQRSLLCASLLSAAAALIHPSYAIFGAVSGVHLLVRLLLGKSPLSHFMLFSLPILITAVLFLGWKFYYFGEFLPNTFHAKVGFSSAMLVRGLFWFYAVVEGHPLQFFLFTLLAVLILTRRVRDPRVIVLCTAISAFSCYGIAIGGGNFPAYRLTIVILPLLFLCSQYVLCLSPLPSPSHSTLRAGTAITITLLAILAAGVTGYQDPKVRVLDQAVEFDYLEKYRAGALELRKRLPPDTLLAYSGAGVIAYYSELPFLDTLGLTNSVIAATETENFGSGAPGHERGNGHYVLSRNPGVVMFDLASFEPHFKGDYELLQLDEFSKRYRRLRIPFQFTNRRTHQVHTEFVHLYVRDDIKLH